MSARASDGAPVVRPASRCVAGVRHFLGGGAGFTGAALAPFFGFFFSLPWELLPFAITHTSGRDSSDGKMTVGGLLC